MTQPNFLDAPVRREKIRRRVRPTSIAQYADGRERFTGRKADVLRWLAATYNRTQCWPTSAELAYAHEPVSATYRAYGACAHLLYVRRGLSDLQSAGVVVADITRMCEQTHRRCTTWRVIPAGRVQ